MTNSNLPATLDHVRTNAERLFKTIGIKRIIVVDDEYAAEANSVEELIGLCTELDPAQASELPWLDKVPFDVPDVWPDILRQKWQEMEPGQQAEVLRRARVLADAVEESGVGGGDDARAALGLHELLVGLCSFVTLSLRRWRSEQEQYLGEPAVAQETLFLFDRNFSREKASPDEGLNLVREAQARGVAICGLITHTVTLGQEHDAWLHLAREHGLDRDRFLVIAKQRLSVEDGDAHHSFLRMVRLVALNSRCALMKQAAWKVFEISLEAARKAMEDFSVFDFDQIVLASSRREGVWEPDTLLRVFSVFMRREARRRLHEDPDADVPAKLAAARKVSAIEVNAAIGTEQRCKEAIRVHRFELFEAGEFLNRHHVPLDLGDIFEDGQGRKYILLAQPCDLMVRPNGRRTRDDRCTRQVTLCELVIGARKNEEKTHWAEIAWYDENSGAPAYVNFAKAHDVRLAVLDLCVLTEDGNAAIDVQGEIPPDLIEPWQKHFKGLKRLFSTALGRYRELEKKGVADDLKQPLLPAASLSAKFRVKAEGDVIKYDVRRVERLNQPRAGALLTSFAQYRSRAAFEHDLDHRSPLTDNSIEGQDVEPGCLPEPAVGALP